MPFRADPSKEYYEILGLRESASTEEIRKAYRKLALHYHPDRNRGDATAEERFKAISEAYAVLTDPDKRKLFDLERSSQGGVPLRAVAVTWVLVATLVSLGELGQLLAVESAQLCGIVDGFEEGVLTWHKYPSTAVNAANNINLEKTIEPQRREGAKNTRT